MNHLIIFIKNPIIGKVKTRLAETIGQEEALIVYVKLLKHTREVALKVDAFKQLYYSDQVVAHDLWSAEGFAKYVQSDGDLGERMKSAFEQSFSEGAKKVVIIGSDCYELEPAHVDAAFKALDNSDFVIGPAWDGGYYLLGCKQPADFLFEGISWSTDSVFDETRRAIVSRGFTLGTLEELRDIDTQTDLEYYTELHQHLK
ncbi:MAG: TIGR04282 family arsenosugar biosynthesis glycosyltransferase [Flavobacteriales bacterium]|nr:TIGR04282 family arsenosugar biosynthesis glycosyltransferase [Flavobacteriales bacterium]